RAVHDADADDAAVRGGADVGHDRAAADLPGAGRRGPHRQVLRRAGVVWDLAGPHARLSGADRVLRAPRVGPALHRLPRSPAHGRGAVPDAPVARSTSLEGRLKYLAAWLLYAGVVALPPALGPPFVRQQLRDARGWVGTAVVLLVLAALHLRLRFGRRATRYG